MGKVDATSRGIPEYGRKVRLGRVSPPGNTRARFAKAVRNTRTRTVVKAKYTTLRTKSGGVSSRAISKIKDSARYYAHRPNAEGERVYRPAFDGAHDELSKHDVAARIEREAEKFDYSYRMVLSPGENMRDDEIKDWARSVMGRAGFESWQYVAFAHAGQDAHTTNPHVHVIAFTDDRMERQHFQLLREIGDIEADDAVRKALVQDVRDWVSTLRPQRDASRAQEAVSSDEGADGGKRKQREMDFDM